MVLEFGSAELRDALDVKPAGGVAAAGIMFEQPGGDVFTVTVFDRFPDMGDTHVEGRRYVEVSVEMFVGLMDAMGIVPVVPGVLEEK